MIIATVKTIHHCRNNPSRTLTASTECWGRGMRLSPACQTSSFQWSRWNNVKRKWEELVNEHAFVCVCLKWWHVSTWFTCHWKVKNSNPKQPLNCTHRFCTMESPENALPAIFKLMLPPRFLRGKRKKNGLFSLIFIGLESTHRWIFILHIHNLRKKKKRSITDR